MKALLIAFCLAVLLGVAWVKRDSLGWPAGDAGEKMSSEENVDLPVPKAVFRDYGGNWRQLEQYKGQVVLVNFWATWCPPCEIEAPTLIRLQEEFAAKGFTIIAIAMDDEGTETVRPYAETKRFDVKGAQRAINFPVFLGTQESAERFSAYDSYPTSFLISREGRQVERISGPVYYPSVSQAIKRLL
jgi:cytochrome c biogenesis protein CcmG, thiol:disulfide interchange protein DsbE